MSDGHTGPDDDEHEGQTAPEQANEAEMTAAEEPVAESPEQVAEKPAPKKRAPRKPKAPGEMAGERPAPRRAAQKPAGPPSPPPGEDEEKRSALREPAVMWSLIGGAIVILAALGYIGWTKFGAHHGEGGTAANALADRSICEATLDRVQSYGVLSPGATLTQADPDKTQVNGRVTCHAQAGTMQYAMTVDVPCEDMGKDTCLKLYSVKQADGTALFQRQ